MKGKSAVFLTAALGFVVATLVFSQRMTKAAEDAPATSTDVTNSTVNNTVVNAAMNEAMNAAVNAATNATTNTTAPMQP